MRTVCDCKREYVYLEFRQRVTKFHVGMLAVQQDTQNSLSRAGIVDDLFREENLIQSTVLDNGTGRLVVLYPLEEEYQTVDGFQVLERVCVQTPEFFHLNSLATWQCRKQKTRIRRTFKLPAIVTAYLLVDVEFYQILVLIP